MGGWIEHCSRMMAKVMLSESISSSARVQTDVTAPELPIGQSRSTDGAFRKVARQQWAPTLLCLALDIVSWSLIYGLIVFWRQDQSFEGPFALLVVQLVQIAVIIQALFVIGGYSARTEARSLAYTAEHLLAMLVACALAALILYGAATFDHSMKPSRASVLGGFLLFTPISLLYRRSVSARMANLAAGRSFLVLGSGPLAAEFYRAYRASPNSEHLEFVSLNEERVGERIAGPGSPLVMGNLPEILKLVPDRYSGIIVTESSAGSRPELMDWLARTQFEETRVYTVESFYEEHWRQVPAHTVDPFWPIQAGFQLSKASPYHYAKRIFDLVASAIALFFLSPLLLIIATLIRLSCGRPIIFRQTRVGRNEQPFTVLKFRTMRPSTGFNESSMYTKEDDPRILPMGRWLRKLRLDELPQLVNVFRGELSLIGPRAEWIECAQRYRERIPFYHFRHLVKPGITGWAQVNYPYGESDADAYAKLTYDLYYIRHYSLKLDAMIVLKTIFTVFSAKGR